MSTEDGTDELGQTAALQSNFDRLITHLRKDSLAEKLVSAYATTDRQGTAQAVKDVMTTRLDELKREYDAPADHQH